MMTHGVLTILNRRLAVLLALIVGTLVFAVSPAQAYEPGRAVAHRPQYQAYTGYWKYDCSFAGWRSGAKVVHHCELWSYTINGYIKLEGKKGNWTPPPKTKNVAFTEPVNMGGGITLCTRARAYSVDGGANSGMVCYFV